MQRDSKQSYGGGIVYRFDAFALSTLIPTFCDKRFKCAGCLWMFKLVTGLLQTIPSKKVHGSKVLSRIHVELEVAKFTWEILATPIWHEKAAVQYSRIAASGSSCRGHRCRRLTDTIILSSQGCRRRSVEAITVQ